MSDSERPVGGGAAREIGAFLRSYILETALGDEHPSVVVDRYLTPDVEWDNDGVRLDRDRLVAHAGPARKNVVACEVEIHDALVTGDRVAARYTLRSTMRKGGALSNVVYLFGELATDGRLRRVHSASRDVSEKAESTG